MENKEMTKAMEAMEAMEEIRKANEGQPEMAGKIHIEAYSNGEKKQETDLNCEGFVVMAFDGGSVEIHIHGCCIAQMAAAIEGSEELREAAQMVANRLAGEKMKKLLREILKEADEGEEETEEETEE